MISRLAQHEQMRRDLAKSRPPYGPSFPLMTTPSTESADERKRREMMAIEWALPRKREGEDV